MTAALAILRRVPVWVWVLLAVLAWGGWQRHIATVAERVHTKAVATAAAAREKKLQADAETTAQRLADQKGSIDDALRKAAANASAAARARDAEQRLRAQLATLTADRRPTDPAAEPDSAATGQTVGLLADMLRSCVARYRELAEYGDATRTAGEACEREYDSLTGHTR